MGALSTPRFAVSRRARRRHSIRTTASCRTGKREITKQPPRRLTGAPASAMSRTGEDRRLRRTREACLLRLPQEVCWQVPAIIRRRMSRQGGAPAVARCERRSAPTPHPIGTVPTANLKTNPLVRNRILLGLLRAGGPAAASHARVGPDNQSRAGSASCDFRRSAIGLRGRGGTSARRSEEPSRNESLMNESRTCFPRSSADRHGCMDAWKSNPYEWRYTRRCALSRP